MNQEKEPQNEKDPEKMTPAQAAEQKPEHEAEPAADKAETQQPEKTEETAEAESEKTEEAETKKKSKPPFYQSVKFRHGSTATAFTAVFIAVIVLVNVLVSILTNRYPSLNLDMTKSSQNSLSAQAVQIVDKVKDAVTIEICATKEQVQSGTVANVSGDYSQIGSLAEKMAERNSKIKVDYVDLDKNPTYAVEYKNDNLTAGDVIVKSDKRYRVLTATDLFDTQYSQDYTTSTTYSNVDSSLASALKIVNSDVLPVAAFDNAHSEKLDSTGFTKLLKNNSFETQDFSLLTSAIPAKTQLLVLGCPTTDLTDEEVTKLGDYLKNKTFAGDRSVLVTYSPGQGSMPKLSAFMEEWGLSATPEKVVMETDSQKYFSNNPIYIMANAQTTLKLGGKSEYNNLIAPYSCPIDIKFTNSGSKQTYSLIKSNDSAYVYKDGDKTDAKPATAAQNLAALSQELITEGTDKSYKANVVAFGSSMMFSSDIVGHDAFSTGGYLVDLAKYTTGTNSDAMNVTTTNRELYAKDININSSLGIFLGLGVFTVLIPLLIMIAGIIVHRRRRTL